jgi:hypothetical protein
MRLSLPMRFPYFGLSPEEIVELRERRRFYYQWLSAAYQTKADASDYTR